MNEYNVYCDSDNKILACDELLMIDLGYKMNHETLIGKYIEELMSPYVAKMHKRMITKIKDLPKKELKQLSQRLKERMSLASRYVIFDYYRNPILCFICVNIDVQTLNNHVLIKFDHETKYGFPTIEDSMPKLQLKHIGHNPERVYIGDFENVTCVFMDLQNSTEFVTKHGGKTLAMVLSKSYDITLKNVLNFHPFVYVHELTGDSIFLVIDAHFMVKGTAATRSHSTLLTITISSQIQKLINKMLNDEFGDEMHMRVGISRGNVSAGVIDGRSYRLFGLTVHMAQRMESKCPRYHLTVTSEFYETLINQLASYDSLSCLKKKIEDEKRTLTGDIKGVGQTKYHIINNTELNLSELLLENLLTVC